MIVYFNGMYLLSLYSIQYIQVNKRKFKYLSLKLFIRSFNIFVTALVADQPYGRLTDIYGFALRFTDGD